MKYLVSLFFCLWFFCAAAQKAKNTTKLDTYFIRFFEGAWAGEGQFSNGKKIEAVANFKLSLDSCWITYIHEDKPPNRYKATSMWGTDKETGKFLAYIFDSFQGHRLFTSDGWQGDSLILINKDVSASALFFQRFIYKKIDAGKFKMSYEVSKDSVIWRLGDSLIFRKVSN